MLPEVSLNDVEVRVRAPSEDRRGPELYPELDLDILILPEDPEDPEVIAERGGIHERIQSEIQHKDKEGEVVAEEMLEIPSALNEVPDQMMEDKDGVMITEADTKRKLRGRGNGGKKMISAWRNMKNLPQYLGEHETQLDSIQRTGVSFNRKKMNGKGFHRWCFVADDWR